MSSRPNRRTVLKGAALAGAGTAAAAAVAVPGVVVRRIEDRAWAVPAQGATVDPSAIPKFVTPLPIPGVMPSTGTATLPGGVTAPLYDISVRQFTSQILPAGMPRTTVWGYGVRGRPETFGAPSMTIEAWYRKPIRVRWNNELVDGYGRFLPPLLPVDQTLHWANPPGGQRGRDMHGTVVTPYAGPVPVVTHVHGAITHADSDGYPTAWYLPAATNIPGGYASVGSTYDAHKAAAAKRGAVWQPGSAVCDYTNNQAATTLWYHDHAMGMTRTNVYSGPAGFYLLRGGPGDTVLDSATGQQARLPGPAPRQGDASGLVYREIPLAIQDRSFKADGSLFYPDSRSFFDGFTGPYVPKTDVAPIWNPEFFPNTMVVNGVTWPVLKVQARRYRFRLLNGCQSRFLLLKMSDGRPLWQIGADGGLLPAPVKLDRILLAPAERADVIVDFASVRPGTRIVLQNLGPDGPYSGGAPGADFAPADANSTGQVMAFEVISGGLPDSSTPPARLRLPAPAAGTSRWTRQVTLNELDSSVVAEDGRPLSSPTQVPAGPTMAMLGTLRRSTGEPVPLRWTDKVTETPTRGVPETWEIHNFTMDAHPIHLHATQFEVLDRAAMPGMDGAPAGPRRPREPAEAGPKDTVVAYPMEITRIKARFDVAGRFVWHCHILEHEDNEMMRPFDVI